MCIKCISSPWILCFPTHVQPLRTILGAHTDPSINVSDPISDHFYKEIWMATCARNATIYQKVNPKFASIATFTLRLSLNSTESSHFLPGVPLPAIKWRQEHPGAGGLPGQAGPRQGGPRPGSRGAKEDPWVCGAVSSTVPERTEPAPSHRRQGGHGPHGGLDLNRCI